MDYDKIAAELKDASTFDLYRLQLLVTHELENPRRTQEIKDRLRPGQKITYLDWTENRLIEAEVVRLKRARVLVRNEHDGQQWNIPFYCVNLDQVDPDIHVASTSFGLERSHLKVGDRVGYRDRQNNDVYGEIIRLNRKTATLLVEDGAEWRVPYGLLFPIIEGETRVESRQLIEGEVIRRE
jgi:SAM-dependent methyltransferase